MCFINLIMVLNKDLKVLKSSNKDLLAYKKSHRGPKLKSSRNSGKLVFRVIQRIHSFLLTLPQWEVFLFLHRILYFGLWFLSSEGFRVIRQNYSFLLTVLKWKYSCFFAVYSVVKVQGGSEICGKSTVSFSHRLNEKYSCLFVAYSILICSS